MRDEIDDRPKGFGYVEFTNLQALMNAISLNGKTLSGRAIKISVAEPPRKGYGDRDHVEDRTAGEWRRSGPLPPLEPGHEKRFTYERKHYFGNHDRMHSDSDNPRDFSNWERKGPLQDLSESVISMEKYDYKDHDWRSGEKYRNGGFGDRNYSRNNHYNSIRTVNTGERPKLVLKPRGEKLEESSEIHKTSTKPNPFGDARPIDSDARIREIEKKEEKKKEERQMISENSKIFNRGKTLKEPSYRFDKMDRKEKNRKNGLFEHKIEKLEKRQTDIKHNTSKTHSGDSLKSLDSTCISEIETDIDGWST
ncbi:hypothetical protein PCK2_000482, partial [Pneumocystis canis]